MVFHDGLSRVQKMAQTYLAGVATTRPHPRCGWIFSTGRFEAVSARALPSLGSFGRALGKDPNIKRSGT